MSGRVSGEKIERKYFAHFIDASFGGATANYVRLGKDLEELNIEMNPESESKTNILGESTTTVSGYSPQVSVGTYYAYEGEALYEHLENAVNNRAMGSDLETTVVDVLLNSDGTVVNAYRENVVVIPQSYGGGTDGIQIPFNYNYNGGRTAGTWDTDTKTFTKASA